MPVILPFDILLQIVQVFFENTSRNDAGFAKPTWTAVEDLVSTSRTLRRIGLKMWFMRLRVKGNQSWDFVSKMSEFYNWVQEITYQSASAMLIPSLHPDKFPFLTSVSVYTVDIHLRRPHMLLQKLPNSLRILVLRCFDTVDRQALLAIISKQFLHLEELELRNLTDTGYSYSGFTSAESPYSFAISMSLQFKPLIKLQRLVLDVHLMPPSIHLYHASYHTTDSLLSCHECIQKYCQHTRDIEAEVSLKIAKELLNLKRIQWLSHFSVNQRSEFDVKRNLEGHVFVKPVEMGTELYVM